MKLALGLALSLMSPLAFAQDEHDHHDHSTMEETKKEDANTHDHHSAPTQANDEPNHDHSTMHHGDDTAPADARDPHAYSNGYTAHSHPYLDPNSAGHMHEGDMLYTALLVNRLEMAAAEGEKPIPQLEAEAWLGTSFDKLLLRTEAEFEDSKVGESENEILWSHAIGPYFDSVLGLRYDAGEFEGQGYAAIGVRGLAPYWFETSANLYVGDQGLVAFNAEAEYDLLFTQRLILSPSLEIDLKDILDKGEEEDLHNRKAQLGFRLRYEIYRRFAPYVGVEFAQFFGKEAENTPHSADKQRIDGVAGIKFWL